MYNPTLFTSQADAKAAWEYYLTQAALDPEKYRTITWGELAKEWRTLQHITIHEW